MTQGLVLAIETSCDETAAAVVADGKHVLSSVVSSQVDIHARYGGVVPEVASRAHVDLITPVIAQTLIEAGIQYQDLDLVAATRGPGLVGSLLVGVSAAKSLALVWGKPFIGVNHLEGHLYSSFWKNLILSFQWSYFLSQEGTRCWFLWMSICLIVHSDKP